METGQEFTLSDLLNIHRHHIQQDLHTLMPGKIVTYYPLTQTADVQPMIKRVTWSGDEEDGVEPGNKIYGSYPLIPNVPVEFPGAGGMVLTFPVRAGDTCDIEFSEASLADYLMTGNESEPSDVGRHKLAFAVVHPVYCPTTALTDSAITGNDRIVLGTPGGVQIQLTGSNIVLGAGATDFVALASLVLARLTTIQATFDAHTHAYVSPGGAAVTAPPATSIGSLASVAATVTKAK